MKNLHVRNLAATGLTLILAGICSLGYSQKKSQESPIKGSIKLEYNYPADKTFKYVSDTKIVQDMDVNGQSMLVNVSMYMGCEVKAAGKIGENLKLEIKIDSMAQNVESPQGMEIHTSGPYTGTQVLYFAVKEGYLIKEAVNTKMTWNIEISDQNMSFPVVMNITSSNGVVK